MEERDALLREGEYIDDLQRRGFGIIQRRDVFRFGTDSVLLAHFAAPRKHEKAVDLGCGTGAIALIMLAHEPDMHVTGVEIQPDIADMAARSAKLNAIEESFRVVTGDMRAIHTELGSGSFSLAVCNPPYFKDGGALPSRNEKRRIARHEGDLSPRDITGAASRLLKFGGRFAVIYPAPRALEMMEAMEASAIAPKRVRAVHSSADRAPKSILMDGVKGGSPGLHWMPPLILRDSDGEYSREWHRIYDI